MDLQAALAYAQSHAGPFLAGAIITRPVLCADLAFRLLMASPFKKIVLLNEPTISAWIDKFQAEFDKKVAAESVVVVEAPKP